MTTRGLLGRVVSTTGVFVTLIACSPAHQSEELGTARQADGVPANIFVNAAARVKQAGGNDLARMRKFFDSGDWNWPHDASEVRDFLNPVGVNGARCANMNDAYLSEEPGRRKVLYSPLRAEPGSPGVATSMSYNRTNGCLKNLREFGWKAHFIVGQTPPFGVNCMTTSGYESCADAMGARGWDSYRLFVYPQFAHAYVRHVAQYSGPGLVVADDFRDDEYLSNPAWNVVAENTGDDQRWKVENDRLYAGTGGITANGYPKIDLDFPPLDSDKTTYITFDLRYPDAPIDYNLIDFGIVNKETIGDSTKNAGYLLMCNPTLVPWFGTPEKPSGCGWTTYPGNGQLYWGVSGKTVGNPGKWETIAIKHRRVGNYDLVTLSRDGQTAIAFTTEFLTPGTSEPINRFEIINLRDVRWEIRDLHIGSRPRNPGGDNFDDGNFMSNPAWSDSTQSATIVNKHLVMPSGNTMGVSLFPSEPDEVLQIALDVRHPTSNDYPIRISLLNDLSGTKSGYTIFASPRSTDYPGSNGSSGFAGSPYSQRVQFFGTPRESLGKDAKWEHLVIKFEPNPNGKDGIITLTRNDLEVLRFATSGLDNIDRLEINNPAFLRGGTTWEVDNVYAWFGNEPMPEVTFEVENEQNHNEGAAWFASGTVNTSDKMYAAYKSLYTVWANAVTQASKEISRPLRIAGPAADGGYPNDITWISDLAADCAANGVRLDTLTNHFYGRNAPFGICPNCLEYKLGEMRDALDSNGFDQSRVEITEWGPDYRGDSNAIANFNHIGAAWTAAFLSNLLGTTADDGDFFQLRTFRDATKWYPAFVDNVYYGQDEDQKWLYPRPTYNVFKMISMMPGTRVSADGFWGNVGGIASASKDAIGVLAYNYNAEMPEPLLLPQSLPPPDDQPLPIRPVMDNSTDQWVQIAVNEVPFTSSVCVTQYLVDGTHSNSFPNPPNDADAWTTKTTPQPVWEKAALCHFCPYRAVVDTTSKTVTLGGTWLGKSAVSLWLITPITPGSTCGGVSTCDDSTCSNN